VPLSFDAGAAEKTDKDAARAEVQRLRDLSPEGLALEIMPAFGPGGASTERKLIWYMPSGVEVLQLCDWLMRAYGRDYRSRPRLRGAVTRGLHVLEDAGLIENGRRWTRIGALAAKPRATPLGLAALANGTVREHFSSD
jgi:hypothetical protein